MCRRLSTSEQTTFCTPAKACFRRFCCFSLKWRERSLLAKGPDMLAGTKEDVGSSNLDSCAILMAVFKNLGVGVVVHGVGRR